MKNRISTILLAATIVFGALAPSVSMASPQNTAERRQQTKNEWRNIAIGSGVLAVIGLLSKDKTLTFAGSAGALYSLYRYEQDRKSQSSLNRARAAYFSKPYFYRDGVRYDRRTVTKNGRKHYQFVKAKSQKSQKSHKSHS